MLIKSNQKDRDVKDKERNSYFLFAAMLLQIAQAMIAVVRPWTHGQIDPY